MSIFTTEDKETTQFLLKNSTENYLLNSLNIDDFRKHYRKENQDQVVNSLEYVIADRMNNILKYGIADKENPTTKFHKQCLQHLVDAYPDEVVNWDNVMDGFADYYIKYANDDESKVTAADLARVALFDFLEQTFDSFDYNMKTSEGVNLLMLTAYKDGLSSGLLSFLVDKGVDVQAASTIYGKAIHFMNLENFPKHTIKKMMTLIGHGADPTENIDFMHYSMKKAAIHAIAGDAGQLFINKNLKDFIENRAVSASKGALSDISKFISSYSSREYSLRAIESMMNVPRKRARVAM